MKGRADRSAGAAGQQRLHPGAELVAHATAGPVIRPRAEGKEGTPHRPQLPLESRAAIAMHQMLCDRLPDRLRLRGLLEFPIDVGMQMMPSRQALG